MGVMILCIYLINPKLNDKFIDESSYPTLAANYIVNNLNLDEIKLFNDYNYGSYLIFRGIPVFIDSRADLYAPEFNGSKDENGKFVGRDIFSDFLNISGIGTFYEDKFEEYGITHVITENNSKLNLLISRDENYDKLYSDSYFTVYKRIIKQGEEENNEKDL